MIKNKNLLEYINDNFMEGLRQTIKENDTTETIQQPASE